MTQVIQDFAEILDPVTPEDFFAEYYGKKPLHVRGTPRWGNIQYGGNRTIVPCRGWSALFGTGNSVRPPSLTSVR